MFIFYYKYIFLIKLKIICIFPKCLSYTLKFKSVSIYYCFKKYLNLLLLFAGKIYLICGDYLIRIKSSFNT